ncbi:unnamed protein product [Malus baccata var. baccata]
MGMSEKWHSNLFINFSMESLIIRPASCVCGNPHGLIRKYGLMYCRQCFRSNAKEIGFIKISIQTSTSAGLEQTLPWIFYHKIELRRAYNCEIMLTKVKIPLKKKKKNRKKTETEPKKKPNRKKPKKIWAEPNRNFGLVSVLAKNRTETNRTQPY